MEIPQTFVKNGGIQAGNSYCVEGVQKVELDLVEGAGESPEVSVAFRGNCPMSANLYIIDFYHVRVRGDLIFAE